MIAFLFLNKLKSFLVEFKNPWKILVYAIITFITVCYGLACSNLIDLVNTKDLAGLTSPGLINYILVFTAVVTLARMIVPNYQPRRRYFPNYYPISTLQHYVLSVIADFMKPFFFFMVLIILIISFNIQAKNLFFLTSGITVLFTAQFLRRIIQYPIDFKLTKVGYILFFMIISTIPIIAINLVKPKGFEYSCLVGMAILVLGGYFLETTLLENRKVEINSSNFRTNIYLKLIFNNKKAPIPLLVGLLFKTIYLIYDLYTFRKTGNHFIDGKFVYWILASPLILFTYVFNNFWGFWTSLYLTFEIHSGDYKDMLKCSVKIILLLLLVDCVISAPLLLVTWHDYLFLIVFYIVSALTLTALSVLWSCILPVKINSTFQIKGSVSFISYLISMLSVVLLAAIRLNSLFYALVPLYFIVTVLVYKLSLKIYKVHKYDIFNKLEAN